MERQEDMSNGEQLRNLQLTQTKDEERKFYHYLEIYARHKGGRRPNVTGQVHIIRCIRAGKDPLPHFGIVTDPEVDALL